MKVTAYYTTTRTMDVDLPAKYDKILAPRDKEFNDAENALANEMIDYIGDYIRQIDTEFSESCGITGENIDWEW